MQLKPLPGYALVKLKKKYESGLSTEKEKYASFSDGVLVDFMLSIQDIEGDLSEELNSFYEDFVDKEVFFAQYTESEPVKHNDDEYVFLPLKELRGAKDA